jgi:hypothetical protein
MTRKLLTGLIVVTVTLAGLAGCTADRFGEVVDDGTGPAALGVFAPG